MVYKRVGFNAEEMNKKAIFIIFPVLLSINLNAQSIADSLYKLAWDKHNQRQFEDAAKLFEKSIQQGKTWAGTYLNAASSWAYADNKEKVFENLNKLPEKGYLDKDFIVLWFSEFYKYHETPEWSNLMTTFNVKIDDFYNYAKTIDFQKLTKKQMLEDFDTLQNKLLRVSPHLMLKEKVYGINYSDYFSNLRGEVEKCNSTDTFAIILYRTLIVCQDGHTSFSSLNPFEHLNDGENINFCSSIAKYEMLYNSVKVTSENIPKFIYKDGKYFLAKEFIFNKIKIPLKSELVSVNSRLPKDYVLENIEYKRSLSWDFNNNCFYSETFLQQDIAADTIVNLIFKDKGKEYQIALHLPIGFTHEKISSIKNGFVFYWEENQILYIRMPKMVNGLFYANEILKYKDYEITKIVVDIRDNPGGSDYDWSDMLCSILPDSYSPKIKLGFNKENSKIFNKMEIFDYKDFPELYLKYIVSETGFEHEGQENIKYKGNIYIFFNQYTYSSAGSLVNLCYYFDNLISVGEVTGRVLGFGTNPSEYELPNSKIKFRIAPTIDLTNVENYQDIFHDKPEIRIETTIDDKILLYDNSYSIEYIKNNDPYMKQIMKH
ncbi:Peptidase family S41 [Williamwhitmania taraxaci]|uniref:Peptidase family S41 n=2 Tax=Williamwhitmania taraxaci TaxID=1640674 RepID=A0A1G6SNZ6_9BACT|nr:Peptidase family S41 [Williamwhitmania taraxaci]